MMDLLIPIIMAVIYPLTKILFLIIEKLENTLNGEQGGVKK